MKLLSRVQLFMTPWTVAHQAPLSMGVSRQEYWSGLPFPSPGDLANRVIEPGPLALQPNSLPSELQGSTAKGRKGSHSVVSDSLRPHWLWPTSLLCPCNFPGKSTGVGCHFLLQGILPTQGLNPGLPHCRQVLYHLSHIRSKF